MQIEKKIIICSILAISIGIASIAPLAFLSVKAETTVNEPWFNVVVPYAYCTPNNNGANFTMKTYGSMIDAIANFTLTPDALKDARCPN